MRGLVPGDGEPAGTFRGEPGLEDYDVRIGRHFGAPAAAVSAELAGFDRTLNIHLNELDATIPAGHRSRDLTADDVMAVIILCAWAHGEWVRIHPFPNGNGRTSRILVNAIAQRYGLPAFMRVRPRPGDEYERIADRAMVGDWQSAIPLFLRLYEAAL